MTTVYLEEHQDKYTATRRITARTARRGIVAATTNYFEGDELKKLVCIGQITAWATSAGYTVDATALEAPAPDGSGEDGNA
ncbi:MAG: hypothetical protein JXQ72_16515 [Anaerolineae bacterium]|nr:hypothetical protein [Anaerolineae bacterium]